MNTTSSIINLFQWSSDMQVKMELSSILTCIPDVH